MQTFHNNKTELGITILLLIMLAILGNPWWMPMGMMMAALILAMVSFGSLVIFVWREQGGDEREVSIRRMSDRMAFLVGASILGLAIIVDTLMHHEPHPWFVAVFAGMILTKVFAHIYSNHKN